MATTPKSTEKVVSEVTEEVNTSVPTQRAKREVVEGVIVEETDELTFRDKIKNAVKKKQVIAGASTVLLLAVGILVARKRNTEVVEPVETPES